jgi:hypothetical protein
MWGQPPDSTTVDGASEKMYDQLNQGVENFRVVCGRKHKEGFFNF